MTIDISTYSCITPEDDVLIVTMSRAEMRAVVREYGGDKAIMLVALMKEMVGPNE